jgi:hypothetical protein
VFHVELDLGSNLPILIQLTPSTTTAPTHAPTSTPSHLIPSFTKSIPCSTATTGLSVVYESRLRSITKGSDRLSAIAGLAERFGRMLKGEAYLAGLWAGNIIEGLSWRPGDSRCDTQNKGYPSWSWASIEDRGGWAEHRMISVSHDTVLLNAFWSQIESLKNPLLDQYLHLSGPILPAHLKIYSSSLQGSIHFLPPQNGNSSQIMSAHRFVLDQTVL